MRTYKITAINVMVIFICFIVISLNVLSLYSTPNPENEKKDLHKRSQPLLLSKVKFSHEDKKNYANPNSHRFESHVVMNKPNIVNFQAMSDDKVNEQKYFAEREQKEREKMQGVKERESKLVKAKPVDEKNKNKDKKKDISTQPTKAVKKADHANEQKSKNKNIFTAAPEKKNLNESKKNVSQLLVTDMVFFDVKIGEEKIGRIEIGLFGGIVPNTTANFIGLSNGHMPKNGFWSTYKGTKFHRVLNKFIIQGGHIPGGGQSIYNDVFPDENFDIKFHGAGWIAMANAGKDTNCTQFFIATVDTAFLNGKVVVFGKVIKGMDVVHRVERTKVVKEKPDPPVIVYDSGSLPCTPFLTDEAPSTE